MQLTQAANNILSQLSSVVGQIQEEDFCKPSRSLNATIGEHLRHTLEFFICLEQGYRHGVINYDKRGHNKAMEKDKFIALDAIEQIRGFISTHQNDKALKLEVGYSPDSEESLSVNSNYQRELVYNIEHAVHHMAIM